MYYQYFTFIVNDLRDFSAIDLTVIEENFKIIGIKYGHIKMDDNYIKTDTDNINNVKNQLDEYFNAKRVNFDFPYELRGTEFQVKVWNALKTIEFSQSKSYSDIADMIALPKATRAVANACGKNPLLIVIPCHRVIRKDGSIGGFSCGVDVKHRLVNFENMQFMVN